MTDFSPDNMDELHEQRGIYTLSGRPVFGVHPTDALQVAQVFHPEFVLLDIGLPKLNGYEVAKRIRQQPWAQDATLIAITGWGLAEDQRRSQDAEFNFHIVKPVDLAALEDLMNGLQTFVSDELSVGPIFQLPRGF